MSFSPKPQARMNRHARSTFGGGAKPQQAVAVLEESALPGLIKAKAKPLVLVLDCVQDVHNLGACLRTADAAGVTAVVIPRDKAAPITEAVVAVSCGAAQTIPIVRVTNLARAITLLKELGLWIVGTSDHQGSTSLYDTDLSGPIALVMGSEGKGMRRLTSDSCDYLIQIPMYGKVDCLNVSVATGVCLYEALRQRRAAAASAAKG